MPLEVPHNSDDTIGSGSTGSGRRGWSLTRQMFRQISWNLRRSASEGDLDNTANEVVLINSTGISSIGITDLADTEEIGNTESPGIEANPNRPSSSSDTTSDRNITATAATPTDAAHDSVLFMIDNTSINSANVAERKDVTEIEEFRKGAQKVYEYYQRQCELWDKEKASDHSALQSSNSIDDIDNMRKI